MTDDYDPRRNSAEGYLFGIRVAREQCIRRGQVAPEPGNAKEARWAAEGDVPVNRLDTVRGA